MQNLWALVSALDTLDMRARFGPCKRLLYITVTSFSVIPNRITIAVLIQIPCRVMGANMRRLQFVTRIRYAVRTYLSLETEEKTQFRQVKD